MMGQADFLRSNITNANKTSSTDFNVIFCPNYQVGPILWAAFTVPCVCVGVPATAWLLWVLIQKQHQHSSHGSSSNNNSNIYTLNLTVMDLIFNVCAPICALNGLLWQDLYLTSLNMIAYQLNTTGRPLSTIFICADCYIAVVHPITYMNAKLARWRQAACVFFWLVPFAYGIATFASPLVLSPIGMVPFLVSLPPIVFFNTSVLRALQRPDPAGRSGVHPQKQRAMRTIGYSLMMTTVAYLPPIVVYASSRLLTLTDEQLFCVIIVPIMIPTILLSALMPVLRLKNLGRLSHVTRARCCV